MRDAIVVLDHDEALAGLIARTLRNLQVYCEVAPFSATLAQVRARGARGLIVAVGNGADVSLEPLDPALLSAGLPTLALGAAAAALCERLGGVVMHRRSESENATLALSELPLFEGMTGGERMLHGLRDLRLPEGCQSIATATERCIGFMHEPSGLYALQYPIERNDPDSVQLLRNFACLVCEVEPVWTEESIIADAVSRIAQAAGDGSVLCAVSGGVDSAVCAKLAHEAVGERLQCVFVDTGLFRQDEPQTVIDNYRESLGLTVTYVDAKESFLKALRGVQASADKERIASALLGQVLYRQLRYGEPSQALVLGTNYNDVLYGRRESSAEQAAETGEALPILEPLSRLFKEEVRRVAKALSLPATLSERQSFPSSGLALRVYGEVTQERLNLLRQADAFFNEEVRATGHERRLWQYYAALSENPGECGGYAVILRASQACSGEACASRLPYDLLERVVARILAELPDVHRVAYDLTPSTQYAHME